MRTLFAALMLGALWTMVACTSAGENDTATPTVEQITALAETAVPSPTRLPSPEPTASEPLPLMIWFPDTLAPLDNGDAAELLSSQISGFQNANDDIFIDLRLKKASEVGGVMSTLRAAAPVAPGALPDLTLMRRADLLSAQQSGLIQPIDERALPGVIDNYPVAVNALGRADGTLFGVPYMIDVRHLALYAPAPIPQLSFEDVFIREIGYVFPAGRVSSMSDTFLAQYRAASEVIDTTALPIDLDALQTVFSFYDTAVSAGLIDPSIVDFTQITDYTNALRTGNISAGVVTSSIYLQLVRDNADLTYAPIPTESGELATVLDGWMWVLTTTDTARQARALRFVNWMLDTDRQDAYGQAVDLLPAQRTALRQWENEDYATFVESLLDAAALPIAETQDGAAARILQSAFTSVINGTRTPTQAVNDVVTQLPE